MQESTHVVGVDPGLVHTGCVRLLLFPTKREVWVDHLAVSGPKADEVQAYATRVLPKPRIFIEGYRPRSNLSTDKDMIAAVRDIRHTTKGVVLNNTGVKKVVRPALLELLGVLHFSTPTHHQDLLSAARIAVLGMLKDPQLNELLADVVRDHLHGDSWAVRQL